MMQQLDQLKKRKCLDGKYRAFSGLIQLVSQGLTAFGVKDRERRGGGRSNLCS